MGPARVSLLLALAFLLLPACGLGGSGHGLSDGEVFYGPMGIPSTVDCSDSDAFDGIEDFESVETCEITFKDGSGSDTVCQASNGSGKPGRIWMGMTCEAAAASYSPS